MKLNPTTKPVGKPTVKRMWVVYINNEEHVFQDADIAHRFMSMNKHRFPILKEVTCE